MTNHTATVDSETIKLLLEEMDFYRRGLTNLRKKMLMILPEDIFKYGSDFWWEKAELDADEDVKKHRISKTYNHMEDLIEALHKKIPREK